MGLYINYTPKPGNSQDIPRKKRKSTTFSDDASLSLVKTPQGKTKRGKTKHHLSVMLYWVSWKFRRKNKKHHLSMMLYCGKRDLNPYGVNHTPLKRARLPVPPLPRGIHFVKPTRILRILCEVFRGIDISCRRVILYHCRQDLSIGFWKFLNYFADW